MDVMRAEEFLELGVFVIWECFINHWELEIYPKPKL